MAGASAIDPVLRSRLEALLGRRIVTARPAVGGYTCALRLVLGLDDGSSCFAKAAASTDTATWLRAEHHFYAHARGSFLPRHIASQDDAQTPLLILEDLSSADWTPRWTAERVHAVKVAIGGTARLDVPALPPLEQIDALRSGWADVAHNPQPFLALGLASASWLRRTLPSLISATEQARLDGDSVLHADLRSDNLCFRADGSVVLIDWNSACRGNARFDLAAWAPSLASEGGPHPEEVAGDVPELAALLAGFFASRAGLPVIADAPRVREVQKSQLRHALPWAARALGLPVPDGGP
jgi:hypothetical protein